MIGVQTRSRLPEGRRLSLGTFALVVTAMTLFGFAAAEWLYGWFGPPGFRFNHGDLTIYVEATGRLFSGGSWFVPRQLDGPYQLAYGDVLYPPVTSLFFAPWIVLPGWSFVVIPSLIVGWLVWEWRPGAWAWVAIGLCLLWPMTGIKVLSANPNVWVAAFVGLGLRYRWPGALVLLKPSFLPLAVIGIRSRGWWLVAFGLVLLSLPFLRDTLLWPSVTLNTQGAGPLYSLWDLPTLLIPVVAWLGRSDLIREGETYPGELG